MTDARFEDGDDRPLRLVAQDDADLKIISALLQDAVFPITEMAYQRGKRRFALLVNRFRWEDRAAAAAAKRGVERVQSMLVIDDVLAVRTAGIDRSDQDCVLSALSIDFASDAAGGGTVTLTLAGNGAIALDIEALEISLDDVTRPYLAPSGKVPDHGL